MVELEKNLPSLSKQACLAALLLQGKVHDVNSFADAGRNALYLWAQCIEERQKYLFLAALTERSKAFLAKWKREAQLPIPKSYPVKFEDFLRLALPKVYPEKQRPIIFREFSRSHLRDIAFKQSDGNTPLDRFPFPTDAACDEIAVSIARNKFAFIA
jgi:hypothetical protein